MALHIPIDSWTRNRRGDAVIATKLGADLFAEWHRTKAAAKEFEDLTTQVKAIIGDGSKLLLRDRRVLAFTTTSPRRVLDKDTLAAALGLELAELDRLMRDSRVPKPVTYLHVVDEL